MLQKFWWRFVRFGFRLLYNELAFTYDIVSWFVSLGEWRAWQRSALRHLPPTGRILELAHGTGNLQLDLHAAGYYQTIGYDLSPYMGQITRYKLERRGLGVGCWQTYPNGSPRFVQNGRLPQLRFLGQTNNFSITLFRPA